MIRVCSVLRRAPVDFRPTLWIHTLPAGFRLARRIPARGRWTIDIARRGRAGNAALHAVGRRFTRIGALRRTIIARNSGMNAVRIRITNRPLGETSVNVSLRLPVSSSVGIPGTLFCRSRPLLHIRKLPKRAERVRSGKVYLLRAERGVYFHTYYSTIQPFLKGQRLALM